MAINETEDDVSLISKVLSEFKTQLKVDDKDLAKFLSNIGTNSGTVEEFDFIIKQSGVQIPTNFVSSLFNLTHEEENEEDKLALLKIIEENERLEKFRVLNKERRENLPIYKVRSEFIQAVRNNDVLVVTGVIGSGKTTQITQYLYEAGYTGWGRKIGCTQPHAGVVGYIAERVAEEFGCNVGEQVGYATSFDDFTSENTLIKYMSDEVLLREIMLDRDLSEYSVIVLDEVNARTVYTDVLFGLVKQLVERRGDLRLVVVSAPLDSYLIKFSEYFCNCSIFTVPTIACPVNVVHLREEPEHNFTLVSAVEVIFKILKEEHEGDILVLWHDLSHILYLVDGLSKHVKEDGAPELVVLPVYKELESSVFKPAPLGKRKVVIASSKFAEVCMTIHGIYYVIDSGLVQQDPFNCYQDLRMESTIPISEASSMLREGIVRHVDKGTYFHIYTKDFYCDKRPPNYLDINRCNLGSIQLIMKALVIQDLSSFDFMDPPSSDTLTSDTKRLYELGAVDVEGHLTQLGRRMVAFPLDPPLSRMLIAGVDHGCSDEIITIISMIQTKVTSFPNDQNSDVWTNTHNFFQEGGDLLTMLAMFKAGKEHDFSEQWCLDNFIFPGLIQRAQVVRNELVRIMQEKCKLEVVSAGSNLSKINKAIASAFFFSAAKKDENRNYRRLVDNKQVAVSAYSVFYEVHPRPEWVVCHWMGERCIGGLTVIDPQWLEIDDVEKQATTIGLADGM